MSGYFWVVSLLAIADSGTLPRTTTVVAADIADMGGMAGNSKP